MLKEGAPGWRALCPCCIDFHAHFIHREVFELAQPHSVSSCFGQRPLSADNPRFLGMLDPHRQVDDMAARGIDRHVISSADVVASRAWAEPAEEARQARLVNDMAADWVRRFPDRFVGTFVLPLGDMALALREMERAVAMGLRVANLPSNHRGSYLGEARYGEMWDAIEDQALVAFIHPDGVRDPWFQNHALWNSIGQSIEEVKVMSSLIYEGVMERHPGLRIVMAHGGGYMPYYMGRLDRNATYRPDTMRNLSKLPSHYLRDFHYDSCVYDPHTLALLVRCVGADRLVLGGDYPFGDADPVGGLSALEPAQQAAVAGGNAVRLLDSGGGN